jgi:acetyltransferase-like isoleucine patch superfamily enzyme
LRIAEHVKIRDQDHVFGLGLKPSQAGFSTAPVFIGDNVWIGAKATITKGVKIGNNCVVGANSVVTCDVPANSVVVGAPARVVRKIE